MRSISSWVSSMALVVATLGFAGTAVSDELLDTHLQRAKAGDPDAQMLVALMYKDGVGVPQNESEAAKWLSEAAHQGNHGAQMMLGTMYFLGRGVPENYRQAYIWTSLSAASGEKRAKTLLPNIAGLLPTETLLAAQQEAAELSEAIRHRQLGQ